MDYRVTLDRAQFSEDIGQIDFQNRPDHEPLTPEELTQLRGVLGALQWRSHQSCPFQSQISGATVGFLKAANKLVRENFHTRRISTRINQLFLDWLVRCCAGESRGFEHRRIYHRGDDAGDGQG